MRKYLFAFLAITWLAAGCTTSITTDELALTGDVETTDSPDIPHYDDHCAIPGSGEVDALGFFQDPVKCAERNAEVQNGQATCSASGANRKGCAYLPNTGTDDKGACVCTDTPDKIAGTTTTVSLTPDDGDSSGSNSGETEPPPPPPPANLDLGQTCRADSPLYACRPPLMCKNINAAGFGQCG